MTVYGRRITEDDMGIIASYMDDEIREAVHGKLASYEPEEFIQEYLERDPEFEDLLRREFDFDNSDEFWTADKETGSFIESYDSISDARKAIEGYEEQDKAEGIYTPNFYDVVNDEHDSVIR